MRDTENIITDELDLLVAESIDKGFQNPDELEDWDELSDDSKEYVYTQWAEYWAGYNP